MSEPKLNDLLGKYSENYQDTWFIGKTNISYIYHAERKDNEKEVCLKVIDKQLLELGDYDFLIEQINREETITKLCNSESTINLYQRIDNQNYIIFELEYFEHNLKYFINNEIINNTVFKEIVIGLANALKVIHSKGVMHRDIKPDNIYINNSEEKTIIKLGDFGSSILIKDNTSEPIGTILYTAPEIIKNVEYDEKCDLWSLGITLYEIYFGYLPYGPDCTHNKIMNIIYEPKQFLYPKTKIPNLDILFKRLLTIDPKDRMNFEEFFDYVFSKDFMNKDVICVNGNKKYQVLYEIISKEKEIIYDEDKLIGKEGFNEEVEAKKNVNKILSFVETGNLPDIMNFSNGSLEKDPVYNNIIYYDENHNYLKYINKDSDCFERNTTGAFILCTNIGSLKLIRDEILKQIKKDKKTTFNLITTGSQCEKIIEFLKEEKDFDNCVKNVCVYCMNLEKWSTLKDKYTKVFDVTNSRKKVVEFIKQFSTKEIKPFPITKLVTLYDYMDKYKDRHFAISQYYGDLKKETFEENIEKVKTIIKEEAKKNALYQKNQNKLLDGFLTFDLKNDLQKLDELIIHEYTKNTFYGDLNKWLMKSKLNLFEPVAYFTARLMYSLNNFAAKYKNYCDKDKKEVHRGAKLTYSCLLPYERAKGKVILFSAFTSTSEDSALAERWAGRDNTKSLYNTNLKFSVVFIIKNLHKKKWISNGIDIQNISQYKKEKEILYQPFSFYFVRDVQIDIKKYTADIYLETIGKEEILEEKIRIGKEIKYNEKERKMEIA